MLLYLTYSLVQIYITFSRTDVSLLKQVKQQVYKKNSAIILSFILSCFFFVSNATIFSFHSLNRFVNALLVLFNWLPFSFFVYANIGVRRKHFWFLCRINSFEDQNTNEHNFNLIINNSCLFKTVTWKLVHILIKHMQLIT